MPRGYDADMTVSVVLPVFKQAEHIGQALLEYVDALKDLALEWELIVVVNGGDVASHRECTRVAATQPLVRVFLIEQVGWGRAVRIGLKDAGGDLLCYTNSARTSGLVLKSLIARGAASHDTVLIAMRRIREGAVRRAASLLYNLECRALFDLPTWDVNGTPKVFPRRFDRLLALTRDDDLIDLEFNLVCQQQSYPIMQVPVVSARRHGGRSTTNWRSAVRLYWGAYQVWRDAARAT